MARERGDVFGIRLYVDEDNRIAQEAYRRLGMETSRYRLYEEVIPD
jgi:ribosomal protein S18 acetylase RimI-like enzyme